MTAKQRGDMNWKQAARNKGDHRVILTPDGQYLVRCANCGYGLNYTHWETCTSCGADGIAEAARVFFAGKGKKEKKMRNDFSDAVDRLPEDRPKQYVFTCEVVVRQADLRDEALDDGMALIRQIGSFEVIDVQELDEKDDRRL